MCGIIGAVAQRDVVPILMEGLRRLEYRGYDSAGVAVLDDMARIERVRTVGKIAQLADLLASNPKTGATGIAHTRWATHGAPNESNAHPHISHQSVAVVHNGIIENHAELRRRQRELGFHFSSETDTEVIVHQIYYYLRRNPDLFEAVRLAISDLKGAYAIGVIRADDPARIVAARFGSPLVVGTGIGEHFIASDVTALVPVTQQFVFLEDGEIAEITTQTMRIVSQEGEPVDRRVISSRLTADDVGRGEYRHYMQKEIYEQPYAIAKTLNGRIHDERVIDTAFGSDAHVIFSQTQEVKIVACGTSYHAGMIARHWFESFAGVPCSVEIASEFRYRQAVVRPDTLFVTLSQSGETADTLAALRYAKKTGFNPTLGIVNVPESTLVRESDLVLMTRAGPEIGVASTKAFTTQLAALLLLVMAIGRHHKLPPVEEREIARQLGRMLQWCEQILDLDPQIAKLATHFVDKHHALFLGRGQHYPVAMEGALKLKEISYIHAEAYPAGELKHGPLALVDNNMPVIAIAPNDKLLEKLESNLEEVRARGGKLYVFTDVTTGIQSTDNIQVTNLPEVGKYISPIAYTLPLQLLAYHVAILKGTDIDQPRKLGKIGYRGMI